MIADNSRIYRDAGIAQPFIDRVMATAPANMWFPTYDELMEAGVLTSDEEIVVGQKSSADPVATAIAQSADSSKSQLPLRIDPITELVAMSATGRTLTMSYRIGRTFGSSELHQIKAQMAGQLAAQTCTAPSIHRFIDAGATVVLAYRDSADKAMFSVPVSHCA